MMEKIEVNGERRHPIYAALTEVADSEGHNGDIRWNFEKFLIAARRFGHPFRADRSHREGSRPRAGDRGPLPG